MSGLSRRELLSKAPPIESWPVPTTELMKSDVREIFENRCDAIKRYVDYENVYDIEESTGISRTKLLIFLRLCLEPISVLDIRGFNALIPFARTTSYTRSTENQSKSRDGQGGLSGILRQTLNKYPSIEEKLINLILKKITPNQTVHEKRISTVKLHQQFIKLLKIEGVQSSSWPFNTKKLGFNSIFKYMNDLLNNNFAKGVIVREESAARAHIYVGNGFESLFRVEEPYDAVQLDAYSINAFFTATFDTPEGTTTDVQLDRIWLIALIEIVSKAILSYTVVYRSEINSGNVIEVLRKALKPADLLELTIPGLSYPENGGMPNEVIPECVGAVWSTLMLDGALAHLAKHVRIDARDQLGFAINWGPAGHFERRHEIERLFAEISKNIFLRYPSTTGSNPGNGRAIDAEIQAKKYRLRSDEAEQLLAVYIAQYNATPSSATSFNSPLDVLRHYTQLKAEHYLPRYLPKVISDGGYALATTRICSVRGGQKNGRRPYIELFGARYTNPVLGQAGKLIGMKLTILIDTEDLRFVKAFLPNGESIGILKAQGRWAYTKHSLKTRQVINSLITKKILVVAGFDDVIQIYLSFLTQRNKILNNKTKLLNPKMATEAVRVAKESNLDRKIVHSPPPNLLTRDLAPPSRPMMPGPLPDLNSLMRKKFKGP